MKRLHAFVVDHEFELCLLVACLVMLATLCRYAPMVLQMHEVRR